MNYEVKKKLKFHQSFTRQKKIHKIPRDTVTIGFSNRVPRLRPCDVEISSNAFITEGLSSRLSTTRFPGSCVMKNNKLSVLTTFRHSFFSICMKDEWSYPWFIENITDIIKVNIHCFKTGWLVPFLEPLIFYDFRDSNPLQRRTKFISQLETDMKSRKWNIFKHSVVSSKSENRTHSLGIGVQNSFDKFLCTCGKPSRAREIRFKDL